MDQPLRKTGGERSASAAVSPAKPVAAKVRSSQVRIIADKRGKYDLSAIFKAYGQVDDLDTETTQDASRCSANSTVALLLRGGKAGLETGVKNFLTRINLKFDQLTIATEKMKWESVVSKIIF